MSGWLVRRAVQAVVTFAVALALLFVLMRAAPGDPLSRLSADRPISQAETRSAPGALRAGPAGRAGSSRRSSAGWSAGDLGTSIEHGRPVTALLAERLPATLLLGGTVLLLNFTLGLWLGVRQAVRRGSRRGPLAHHRSRSPATRCRRSGWAWCWRGWSGVDWRLAARRPGCRIRCSSSDAGFLAARRRCGCAIWCCRRSPSRW